MLRSLNAAHNLLHVAAVLQSYSQLGMQTMVTQASKRTSKRKDDAVLHDGLVSFQLRLRTRYAIRSSKPISVPKFRPVKPKSAV